jgi:CBS domain containing-hemolysin-like protein
MKLISAIKIIEGREKRQRKAEKEMQRHRLHFGNGLFNMQNPALIQGSYDQKNLVHVQSIFPQEDVIALKEKTKEAHIKEAISKAVYFYLHSAD